MSTKKQFKEYALPWEHDYHKLQIALATGCAKRSVDVLESHQYTSPEEIGENFANYIYGNCSGSFVNAIMYTLCYNQSITSGGNQYKDSVLCQECPHKFKCITR